MKFRYNIVVLSFMVMVVSMKADSNCYEKIDYSMYLNKNLLEYLEFKNPISNDTVYGYAPLTFGFDVYNLSFNSYFLLWPITEENSIIIDYRDGYGSFYFGFERLSSEEINEISLFLKENYHYCNRPKTHYEKLEWIEKIYRYRNESESFWFRFYCLKAYVSDDGTIQKDQSIRAALELLPAVLDYDKVLSEQDMCAVRELLSENGVDYLLNEYIIKYLCLGVIFNRYLGEVENADYYYNKLKLLEVRPLQQSYLKWLDGEEVK